MAQKFNKTHLGLVKNLAERGNAEAISLLNKHFPDKDVLQKNIGDYAMDERLVDQKAQELIMYMWQNTPIMNEFSHEYTRDRVTKVPLGITDKEFLVSTERLGRQLTAGEKQGLGAINSFDVFCEEIEAQWDIKIGDLIYNLGNPNYMDQLEKAKIAEIGNDVARLTAYGEHRDATSFSRLLYGFPHRLRTMNGKNTFSTSSQELLGKNGFLMTPVKLDAGASPDAGDTLTIMNRMIRETETQHLNGASFMMSREDANNYADMRAIPVVAGTNEFVGVNVALRETWLTNGTVPPFKGYRVVHCEHMRPLRTNGVIVLGNLKNLTIVSHTEARVTKEYKARLDTGGNGYEFTYVFYMNLAIKRPYAMTVAFRNATVETPVVMAGAGAKPEDGEVEAGGSISVSAAGGTATVYPYTDTVGAEIYYAALADVADLDDYATAVDAVDVTTFKIDNDDPSVDLAAGTWVFRSFKDGKLTQSAKKTITVTDGL